MRDHALAGAVVTLRNYREAYGLFAVNGILFNHESPRRGDRDRTWARCGATACDQPRKLSRLSG